MIPPLSVGPAASAPAAAGPGAAPPVAPGLAPLQPSPQSADRDAQGVPGVPAGSGTLLQGQSGYAKSSLTFSNAIGAAHHHLWWSEGFATSMPGNEVMKVPRALFERLTDTLCYAA